MITEQPDPKPQPPAEPGPDDCCHSGCTWCVLDLYYDDLERYSPANSGSGLTIGQMVPLGTICPIIRPDPE
ncbi:oxidoreductase-like domain-containing protein [Massilia sp. SR12]